MLHALDVNVLGECVADTIRYNRAHEVTYPGGSAANLAVGLARLERHVGFFTCLGDDDHGDLMRAHLHREDVDLVNIATPDASTPSAAAVLDDSGAASYTFSVARATKAPLPVPEGAHLHLGSFPVFLSEAPEALDSLLTSLEGTCSVSLDLNVRPELMGDAQHSRARLEAVLRWVDVIKASDEDIEWLYPQTDPETVARRWVAQGTALAVVTKGAEGCFAVNAKGVAHVAPVRVDVVDTLGAGDTLMAALIDGLMEAGASGPGAATQLANLDTEALAAILARAARAAAINVSRAGANPPTRDELDG